METLNGISTRTEIKTKINCRVHSIELLHFACYTAFATSGHDGVYSRVGGGSSGGHDRPQISSHFDEVGGLADFGTLGKWNEKTIKTYGFSSMSTQFWKKCQSNMHPKPQYLKVAELHEIRPSPDLEALRYN